MWLAFWLELWEGAENAEVEEEEHVLMVRLSYGLNYILLVEEPEDDKGKVVGIREELPQVLKLEHIC